MCRRLNKCFPSAGKDEWNYRSSPCTCCGGDYQELQLVAALRNVDLFYGGLVAFPFPHSFEVSWLGMSGAGAIRQRPSV